MSKDFLYPITAEYHILFLLKLKSKKQMKIILTFRMKTTSIQTVVLKQVMDELTGTNNSNFCMHGHLFFIWF